MIGWGFGDVAQGVMVHACLSTGDVEEGEPGVQGHPQLHSEFKGSMSYGAKRKGVSSVIATCLGSLPGEGL